MHENLIASQLPGEGARECGLICTVLGSPVCVRVCACEGVWVHVREGA